MKKIWKIAALGAVAGAVWMDNHLLQTTHYTVCSPILPQPFWGYKIVQLSDLHATKFGKENDKLLRAVRREKPDAVVLTGDMVNKNSWDFSSFFSLLFPLAAEFPCYFIEGNHEQRLTPLLYQRLKTTILKSGTKILENQKIPLLKGNKKIDLYGMVMPMRYYRYSHDILRESIYFTEKRMEELLGKPEDGCFSILLAHNPLYFPTYSRWGADLTLCGHMHGGAVRLPGGKGLLSPERKFFPKYTAGKFYRGNRVMIVNRGLGDSLGGLRMFNRPEIVSITLAPSDVAQNGAVKEN